MKTKFKLAIGALALASVAAIPAAAGTFRLGIPATVLSDGDAQIVLAKSGRGRDGDDSRSDRSRDDDDRGRGRGRGRGGDDSDHDDGHRSGGSHDDNHESGSGRDRPRIPGGSGCDDPGDVAEHAECRV